MVLSGEGILLILNRKNNKDAHQTTSDRSINVIWEITLFFYKKPVYKKLVLRWPKN